MGQWQTGRYRQRLCRLSQFPVAHATSVGIGKCWHRIVFSPDQYLLLPDVSTPWVMHMRAVHGFPVQCGHDEFEPGEEDALYAAAVEYAAAMMGVTTAPDQRLASTWGARLVPGTVPPEALDGPDTTVVRRDARIVLLTRAGCSDVAVALCQMMEPLLALLKQAGVPNPLHTWLVSLCLRRQLLTFSGLWHSHVPS